MGRRLEYSSSKARLASGSRRSRWRRPAYSPTSTQTGCSTSTSSRTIRLCGRLPLAIQLTAARLAQGYPRRLGDLVDELSQTPARLNGPGEASPQIMSAFDLSYRALDPGHQRFFRQVSINPCRDVSPDGAAALSGCTLVEAERALS